MGPTVQESLLSPNKAIYSQNEAKDSPMETWKEDERKKLNRQSNQMCLPNFAVHPQNETKESAQEIHNLQEKVKPMKMNSVVQIEHHQPPKELFSSQKEHKQPKFNNNLEVLKLQRIPEEEDGLPDISC